MRNHKMFL